VRSGMGFLRGREFAVGLARGARKEVFVGGGD